MIAYPLYIDVPMMMSVLASIEGGVAQSKALASLGIDLEGRVGVSAEPTAANAIAQRHTIGSLFASLRHSLSERTVEVSTADELSGVSPGDFVEVIGTVTRNPMVEFVNVMERLFSLSQIQAGAGIDGAAALEIEGDEETRKMFAALRQELDGSPVLDATLTTGAGLKTILSFQKAYVSHESLDDLRFGQVRVLGKAVGNLEAGQTWSVLSRSLVGHMMSSAFDEAMNGLVQVNPEQEFPVESHVAGPALMIVPLAVFI